ncbi:MAG: electron transfer flavoprotein subunit alpha/FixB family protein [Pseudomonadota bacterium]
MSNILIIAEHSNGKLKKYSMELAGKAAELAGKMGGNVTALLIGDGLDALASELGHFGVKRSIVAAHDGLKSYSGEAYSKVLCDVIAKESPSVVLATASVAGKDMMARAAMRLKTGLASDCVLIDVDGGKIKLRRPIYAGKALMDIMIEGSPQMATLRPNSFPVPAPASNSPEVAQFAADPGPVRAKVTSTLEAEAGMIDLTEADRIVSGGRAMGSSDNFKIIRELAKSIGASVGASRAAVDAGYMSHDHQVGQTGKTVNPTIYIACGISGAIQHLAGMRTSKVIVAINKDSEAPIFSKADYGIVGDLFKVVPAMTEAFKKLLSE